MTDVKAHQADRFLRQLPREIVAVLFYGTDPGLVSERGERLATAYAAGQSPPGEVLRLTEDDVSASPDRLAVELRTLPMFGGRNAVRFLAPSLTKPDLVTDLLDGGPLEALLIVEAGNLKPDSKLRAAFAKAATAAAVACYADEPDALRNLAREVMTAGRIRFAPGAESHLLGLLGADRALSRGELEARPLCRREWRGHARGY
ncbi:MAG: hypothetical protein R3D33_01725 [Hyphomicrobiaceae bacterium]